MQLTIKTFPKYRPNITLERVQLFLKEIDYEPSNKEIRLAIDLATQVAPLKFDREDVVRSILQCDIINKNIDSVVPFSEICFKKVIIFENGKYRTKKIIRWRNPENLKKLRQRNVSK